MSTILGADLAPFVVPDAIEPVRAWRRYRIRRSDGLPVLESDNGVRWVPGKPLHASCQTYGYADHDSPAESCRCGIYAARDLATLDSIGYGDGVLAEVALWGKVIPADLGYRAEWAYPVALYCDDADLAAELAVNYGVPVHGFDVLGEWWADRAWANRLADETAAIRQAKAQRRREEADREREARRLARRASYRAILAAGRADERGGFGELVAWILQGREGQRGAERPGRPWANNTRLYLDLSEDGFPVSVTCHLHATDVARWYVDGTFWVNTGGWDTVTTKERINRFIGQCGGHFRVGSMGHELAKVRRWGRAYSDSTTRVLPGGWRLDGAPERPDDGRTREGRAQWAKRRAWIMEHCPELPARVDCNGRVV